MSSSPKPLSLEQLIRVFSLTKTATAIHLGESAVISFANDAMLRVWGKDESVLGKTLEEALPELQGQPFIEMFARVWREGLTLSGTDTPAVLEIEGEMRTFYFDFEYRAVLDDEGKTLCILHSAIDVTDRVTGIQAMKIAAEKEAALMREQSLNEELLASTEELSSAVEELRLSEENLSLLAVTLEDRVLQRVAELAESEQRFRVMAEGTHILIAVGDERGKATYFNKAWEAFTGWSEDELLAKGWASLIHPDDRESQAAVYKTAFWQRKPFSFEIRMLNKEGQYRWLFLQAPPRFRPDGSFAGYISSCIDITDRKEEELRSKTLNAILESSMEFIGLFNPELEVVYCNPAALEKLGWNGVEGRQLTDCIYPGDREYALEILPEAFRDGKFKHEIRFYNEQTGEPFWMEWNAFVIKDPDTGDMISLGAVNQDITERKHYEQKLQSNNEEMAAANEELAATNEEMAATNEELEEAHRSLVISESRFRSLILQAPFGICHIRAEDLMVLVVNDNYLSLVGKSRQELEHVTIWEAVEEAADTYAPVMQEVIRTGIPFIANEHEVMLIRNGLPETLYLDFIYEPVRNSSGIVVSIMVVVIEVTEKVEARRKLEDAEERVRLAVEAAEIGTYGYDYATNTLTTSDRFCRIYGFNHTVNREDILAVYHPSDRHLSDNAHRIAQTTGTIYYEARILQPDNGIKWVRVQGKVYFDDQGKRTTVLGTVIDITEYKSLQQQKDDFITIASHELKTPITSLKASLQLMERMKQDEDVTMLPFLVDQSSRSMSKISELVDDLLNVSKISEGQILLNKKEFNIAQMLDECCNHVRVSGKYDLIFEGNKDLKVFADEQRIDQVVVNFVNNAVKYAPDALEIRLIVERDGHMAKVSVKDKGPGIPASKIPHLFDRYYRAHESGVQSGLGLGLYICADIISRHDGEIGVDSEEGKGSTFWFRIPLNNEV